MINHIIKTCIINQYIQLKYIFNIKIILVNETKNIQLNVIIYPYEGELSRIHQKKKSYFGIN